MISAAGKRPNDLRAGAVEAAILAIADYLFDGKFGHGGDASGVFFMVRDLAWLSRFTGRGFSGHGFAGFRSRICGVEVTDLQVRAYVTNMWGRRLGASPIPGRRARPPEQRKIRTPEPHRGLRGIPNVVLDVVCTRHERD